MAQTSFGLPRDQRIRKRKDFDRVFDEGGRIAEDRFRARYLPNGLPFTRVGVAVPRKFGKAARRNRARRLLKEAFRLRKDEMPAGIDIIFLPGRDWDDPPLSDLEKAMARIAERLSERCAASREAPSDD